MMENLKITKSVTSIKYNDANTFSKSVSAQFLTNPNRSEQKIFYVEEWSTSNIAYIKGRKFY